jgi:hypothetical protein
MPDFFQETSKRLLVDKLIVQVVNSFKSATD